MESSESVETVNLNTKINIRPPERDKHFMITFQGINEATCALFNRVIGDVLDQEFGSNSVFHQVGRENLPGVHGWEIWGKKDEEMRKKLESLTTTIYERAREIHERGY